MIIFGWRGVTTKGASGAFHCPACGAGQPYIHKRVRRFFTLYFIPVIPLNQLGEYIECQGCQGTFHLQVLDYRPEEEEARIEARFQAGARQVMIHMLLADGVIDDSEFHETERALLWEIGQGLGMTPAHFKGLISELMGGGLPATPPAIPGSN